MEQTKSTSLNRKGFTLVELLVVLVIAGIMLAAIGATFQSQNKSYIVQDQVSEMQQNLRAGMLLMMRDVRMAGYDPTRNAITALPVPPPPLPANSMILIAGPAELRFRVDVDGDGDLGPPPAQDTNEDIRYHLTNDANNDGINDAIALGQSLTAPSHLGRDIWGGGLNRIAEKIDVLGFAYAFDADGDGALDTYIDTGGNTQVIWAFDSNGNSDLDRNLDTNNDGVIDAADGPGAGGNGPILGQAIAPVALVNIRAIRIWMLGRTGRTDDTYANRFTYVVGDKVITPRTDADPTNNKLHMKLVEANIRCRNLGL